METTIKERWRGTKGAYYFYVVEGNELVHVGDYALSSNKHENIVIHRIPVNKVTGKTIYRFYFSNSGLMFLGKCKIEDFKDGSPEKCESSKVQEIYNLRFRVKDPLLQDLQVQFKQLFIPMVHELKEYEREKGFNILCMGKQRRLESMLEDPERYYFEFMCIPEDRRRAKSLKETRKWIYELWVMKLLCDAIEVSKFKGNEQEGNPCWWIEQGSEVSTCIAETPYGDFTLWLEFQPSKGAHMLGMFAGRRVPVRPDIVVARGSFERTEEFVESENAIDLLVECKEDPFDSWKREIESQILPYRQIFKPNNLILVSLEHIPEDVRGKLEDQGIKAVDNLKSKDNVKAFYDAVRDSILKS
jgi:hypothetical protein